MRFSLLRRHFCTFVAASGILGAAATDASSSSSSCEESSIAWMWQKPVRLRIALIRHGESMNNVHEAISEAAYVANRTPDPDLSPRGFEQAALLGALLSDGSASALLGVHPVTELWVSPVKRTLQTMQPTADGLALSPRVRLDCFECGGIYRSLDGYKTFEQRGGLPRSEMRQLFPNYTLPSDGLDEEGWYKQSRPHMAPAHGGRESDEECRARVANVAASIREEAAALTESKQVVLVAHYDFICALLDHLVLRGEPQGPFVAWRHYNTGVTVVDVHTDGTVATSMVNAVPHLVGRPDLVSGFDM